ncbi:unnamed protein product, partial [Mesorhabditis spiculigera]
MTRRKDGAKSGTSTILPNCILTFTFLFLSFVHSGFLSYNSSFISMTDVRTSPLRADNTENITEIEWNNPELMLRHRRVRLSVAQIGWGFAVGALGSGLGLILVDRIRKHIRIYALTFLSGSVISATCLILPYMIANSFVAFTFLRLIRGIISGILPMTASKMLSKWVSDRNRKFWTIVFSTYVEMSPLIALTIAKFAGSARWPLIFYIHGGTALFLTIGWAVVVIFGKMPRLDQENDSETSLGGNKYVLHTGVNEESRVALPLWALLKNFQFWAVMAGSLGHTFGVQFSLTCSLLFYANALKYTPRECAGATLYPILLMLIVKIVTSCLFDDFPWPSKLNKIKIFNSMALFGCGGLFWAVTMRNPDGGAMDVGLLATAICCLGFYTGGCPKLVQTFGKADASTINHYTQVSGHFLTIISSFWVPYMGYGSSFEEWAIILRTFGTVLICCNCVFLFSNGKSLNGA